MKYDEINNEQRELIYSERDMVLERESIRDVIISMMRKQIHDILVKNSVRNTIKDVKNIILEVREVVPMILNEEYLKTLNVKKAESYLDTLAVEFYQDVKKQVDDESEMKEIEKMVFLRIMDRKWTNHIDNLEKLREGIGIQAYGQKDPLIEYKTEAYRMFEEMLNEIRDETIKTISHMKVAKRES